MGAVKVKTPLNRHTPFGIPGREFKSIGHVVEKMERERGFEPPPSPVQTNTRLRRLPPRGHAPSRLRYAPVTPRKGHTPFENPGRGSNPSVALSEDWSGKGDLNPLRRQPRPTPLCAVSRQGATPPRAFASLRSPRERGTPLSESPVGRSNLSVALWEDWSGKGDLNPRPSPWQGDALPLSYSRSREGL